MKISYNWLKEYLDFKEDHESIAEKLTSLGLEVEGITKFQSIPGGLEGVVIGKTKSIKKHPNADRLKITTVDIGQDELLQIICGAPNVDKNQTVAVATAGTTLYPNNEKLKIKKSKIRGEVSNGMICGQDELNLGEFDQGIMIFDDKYKAGIPLSEIYNIESDWIYDIGLTPNRADAMSHYGTARDLRARLLHEGNKIELKTSSVSNFIVDNRTKNIKINIDDDGSAPRYCGIVMDNITVQESPKWLQNKIISIGLTPINNIVDITNYILHDIGQPLHAFDYDKIEDQTINVKKYKKEIKFKTLDEIERTLSSNDLTISDSKKPLCLAGIFGGIVSGISKKTTSICLESAYFDPITVRKSAKHHNLSTDSSYRFERGVDPNISKYALKRAVLMIKEICERVDFISIGTNDLIQYTIAADRTNETLEDILSHYQPSVLRMLKLITSQVPEDTYVTICGEMANDINCLPLFIGMGIRELSMNYYSIPRIKGVIHDLSYKDCNIILNQCLELTSPKEIKHELINLIKKEMSSNNRIINYGI